MWREDAELVQANWVEGVIHLRLSRSQEWMSQNRLAAG